MIRRVEEIMKSIVAGERRASTEIANTSLVGFVSSLVQALAQRKEPKTGAIVARQAPARCA